MGELPTTAEQNSSLLEISKKLYVTYEPELTMLTGNVNATPELGGVPDKDKTVGETLFPSMTKDQVKEFDRTMVGLLTFEWALEGNYEKFTECQSPGAKLTPESFSRLHEYTKSVVVDNEAKKAMETYLVINDLTKVKSVVDRMEELTGKQELDHDVVLLDVLQHHPEMSPSFSGLLPKYQELIINGLKAKFNMGHLSQAEGPAAILSGLKDIDQDSLNFYLIHVLFDTAGVVGHIKQNGSLVMNEPTYRNLEIAIDAIDYFRNGHTEQESYDHMLEERSKDWNIDVKNNSEDKTVARVACMMRLSGTADQLKVDIIKSTFDALDENDRNTLVDELNKNGIDDEAILIYYGPAILANAETAFKRQNDPDSFVHAVGIGLQTFTKLFKSTREIINEPTNSVFTLMSNEVAGLAGKDPSALLETDFKITKEGSGGRVNYGR